MKSYHESFKNIKKPPTISQKRIGDGVRVIVGDESEYGFNHNDLVDTSTIILSGQQFEKFYESMKLSNRLCVSRGTYYRYLPVLRK